MKLRDSGMPGEEYWESLFDVPTIIARMTINESLADVAELGCGYGTFSLPIARAISGTLLAYDIDASMIARTRKRAAEAGLKNIVLKQRDVAEAGFGLPNGSVDAALLFNILHCEQPIRLLSQAADLVHPQGKVLVIHWRYDPETPRGPTLEIRPKPEQIMHWAEKTGRLCPEGGCLDLPPWHYGLRLSRCS